MNKLAQNHHQIDSSNTLSVVDDQYLNSLQNQCNIRYNALKTAEHLILAYQQENQSLRQENHQLKQQLTESHQQSLDQSQYEAKVQKLERRLLKYSMRINELLEKNVSYEHKVAGYEQEMRVLRGNEEKMRLFMKNSVKKKEERQHKRRVTEQTFQHFLKLPSHNDSLSNSQIINHTIPSDDSFRHSEESQVNILSTKVKQKDQQILILLRRLRDVEQDFKVKDHNTNNYISIKHERLNTCDTTQNNGGKIKKYYYSPVPRE